MSPVELNQAEQITQDIERNINSSGRLRAAIGLGFIAAGVTVTGALLSDEFDDTRFSQEMPFNKTAQEYVNNVDDMLGGVGRVVLPASLLGIGIVKLGARRSSRLQSIDKRSSQELSDDGHPTPNIVRRGLRQVAAGSLPVVVGASAAVGGLTAGIGTEITEGPSRPIIALDQFAPGEAMIAQYENAMPMLESSISQDLTSSVEGLASERSIDTTPVSLGLNSFVYNNQNLTGLTLGIEADKLPEDMAFTTCEQIPVIIDSAANIPTGSSMEINGIATYIVDQVDNISATNRIGAVMDQEALETCVKKNSETLSHAVILDTDPETAEQILSEANEFDETATVISKEQYIQNSNDFWESNVKPITNTLALVGLMTSFIAMSGSAVSRMLRNRRELAAKRAAGESVSHFRATELVRSAKDGVLGSTVGVAAAAGLTVPVNAIESGMRVGLGLHEAMVAYAVGIVGTIGGTAIHMIRPNKVVDPSEHTRV